MKLNFTPAILYFQRPFKIAHGVRSSTNIVLTQLEHEGIIGFGEASMPPYLSETHETALSFLNKAANLLSGFKNSFDIEMIIKAIDELAPGNTAAKASVDIALHDLLGKLQNKSCWQLFNCEKENTPYTTYTLGIDEPEIIKQKLIEGNSFKTLKVKLNGENDKLIISTIRSLTNKPIAIDVNQGWKDKHQALEMINWLQDKNVLFIEQPLPKENVDDAFWLYERSPLPLFADESIQRFADIDKVKNCFHGINIKLMKCTGIFEANRMISYARQLNLKILIGCMTETSCAVSAAAQLSPLVDYADLDAPLLIKNNFFDGIEFINGKITLNDLPGIGVVQKA
ncbi:MAG: dipeptide epimerase [Bacteroidetes bacterium RIFCSPLOWO2_12_FULL_35_15]|nr:MAG: dipeptide epimerase [Bacteroidetes bacterium RIFCSPLOWO2_12_FULL_35_15]